MNKEFSSRLRFLRKSKGYTQKDLASLLNLGQTTIANYENGTRIPDIFKLVEIADLFHVPLDYLFGRKNVTLKKYELILSNEVNYSHLVYEEYLRFLINGERDKATNICLSLLEKGMDISKVYQYIIKPSLIEVGILWEKGIIDIWKEHLISEISLDIMRVLHSKFNRKIKNKKTMIALTPGVEQHNIGIKMVCSIFELAGWNTIYLGSNIPTNSILYAIKENKPSIIALSVTLPNNIESAKHLIEAIRKDHPKDSLRIILGGQGLDNFGQGSRIDGADNYFKDISELTLELDEVLE